MHFHLQFNYRQCIRQLSSEQIVGTCRQLGPIQSTEGIAGPPIRQNDPFGEKGVCDGLDRLDQPCAERISEGRSDITGEWDNPEVPRGLVCGSGIPAKRSHPLEPQTTQRRPRRESSP
jgi:hypothetical protein